MTTTTTPEDTRTTVDLRTTVDARPLTPSQRKIVVALRHHGPATAEVISDRTALSLSTVRATMAGLQRRGLAERLTPRRGDCWVWSAR